MPYMVLIAGLLIGIIALYQFMIRARVAQIRTLVYTFAGGGLVLMLLYLALTGRILPAIVLIIFLFPFFLPFFKKNKNAASDDPDIIDVTPISTEIEEPETQAREETEADENTDDASD